MTVASAGASRVGRDDARPERRIHVTLAVAGVALALDQLSKWWAVEALDGGRVIDLVWTLRLRLVWNTGSAFGMFPQFGPVVAVVALVLAVGLLCFGRLAVGRSGALGVGGIVGGALGNLADRAFRPGGGVLGGAVVDFIDVQWWPVWNVADMCIVGGAAAVIWAGLRGQQTQARPSPASPSPARPAGGANDV